MSAREAPLRSIIRTYTEPADGGEYHLLDCGHSVRVEAEGGIRRRRCRSCAHALRRAEQNLAKAGQ